jgi:DNA-binding transcriptional regulator LsrR (DeoR family)
MSRADELRLITRIAQMYYADAMKQSEIAATLHIPQARISRLLKRISSKLPSHLRQGFSRI